MDNTKGYAYSIGSVVLVTACKMRRGKKLHIGKVKPFILEVLRTQWAESTTNNGVALKWLKPR
jgi:hypothetical protein